MCASRVSDKETKSIVEACANVKQLKVKINMSIKSLTDKEMRLLKISAPKLVFSNNIYFVPLNFNLVLYMFTLIFKFLQAFSLRLRKHPVPALSFHQLKKHQIQQHAVATIDYSC